MKCSAESVFVIAFSILLWQNHIIPVCTCQYLANDKYVIFLFLVIPHVFLPVVVSCFIVGKPNIGYVLAVQNGEIGLLGDLTQLPVVVEEGRGDHNSGDGIRVFGFHFCLRSRGCLQQLVHTVGRPVMRMGGGTINPMERLCQLPSDLPFR